MRTSTWSQRFNQGLLRGLNFAVTSYVHCDFEDSEQSESPEDREAERARFRLEVSPDDLEDGAGDDEAVEAVEARLEVDPRPHGPHPEEHLEDEETQEHEFGRV